MGRRKRSSKGESPLKEQKNRKLDDERIESEMSTMAENEKETETQVRQTNGIDSIVSSIDSADQRMKCLQDSMDIIAE